MIEVSTRVDSPRFGRGTKIASGAGFALVIGLFLLEWLVLRGESVASLSVGLGPTDTGTLVIDRLGKEHLVEIDTRSMFRSSDTGRAVAIKLEDPDGNVVYEDTEIVSRKERFFSFRPAVAGSYRITVRPGGILSGSSSGRAHVNVLVGDKRFLSRFLAFLPF